MWVRSIDDVMFVFGLGGHALLFTMLISRKVAARLPLFAILIGFYMLCSGIFVLGDLTAVSAPLYWTLIRLDPVLQFMLYVAVIERHAFGHVITE